MFRRITLPDDPEPLPQSDDHQQLSKNPISFLLEPMVVSHLHGTPEDGESAEILRIFRRYVDELQYICATHTISNTPGVRLLEAEVVTGTILAKCSQKRWRKDRMYRMRLHASTLVRDVQRQFVESFGTADHFQLTYGLEKAWQGWTLSQRCGDTFGANSFGLISLGVVFDCLDKLGAAPVEDDITFDDM